MSAAKTLKPVKSTKPSTKKRAKKVLWGDRDEKGKLKTLIQGKDITGWNPTLHLPLRKKDFANAADYYDVQAERLESKASRLRQLASDERTLGKDRKKARRLKALHQQMLALRQELTEERAAAILTEHRLS